MRRFLNQPLLHFIFLGGVLFLIYTWIPGKSTTAFDDKTIDINREAVLDFMQFRSQAFNRDYFAAQLGALTKSERRKLIDEMAREEVLYREALALHLNDNDYVIKRRLVQKLEFLNQGFIAAGRGPTDTEIGAYYKEHRDDYYEQPSVTFTHVFIDYARHNNDEAQQLAEQTLKVLYGKNVPYSDAIKYGDRFLYHANYVDRSPDYVASHFGSATAAAIFALQPDARHWVGPFTSEYGLHLILLVSKSPGRYPELEEIKERVREDVRQELLRRKTERVIGDLIKTYNIRIAPDLQ